MLLKKQKSKDFLKDSLPCHQIETKGSFYSLEVEGCIFSRGSGRERSHCFMESLGRLRERTLITDIRSDDYQVHAHGCNYRKLFFESSHWTGLRKLE